MEAVEITMRSWDHCLNCGKPLLNFEYKYCCQCAVDPDYWLIEMEMAQ
jgi:hypothetical protein